MCDRIVALVDMDCFYCQVESRLNPALKGKPMAVVQYNQWQGGGIIAVNYEAREFGVTRHLRGSDAKQKCRDIVLVSVPSSRGKADLTKYREAGREVVAVLCQFSDCVERASVDEAYLDLTQAVEKRMQDTKRTTIMPGQLANTFVVGFGSSESNDEEERSKEMLLWLENVYHSDLKDDTQERLAVAGAIVEEMRAAVYAQTGFRCSAGIAHNKILGKLACGLHKPNRQTILPHSGVMELYRTLPIKKVRSMGGKFGDAVVELLGCKVMADLNKFTEPQLQQTFDDKTGSWLYNIAKGIDSEPVTPRLISKSIGCCKKFPGKQALATKEAVEKWLFELASEVSERLVKDLEENNRRATLLTVGYQQTVESRSVSSTRCGPLNSYKTQEIVKEAMELLRKSNTSTQHNCWIPPLKYLGISVGKFEDKSLKQTSTINSFFKSTTKALETNQADDQKPTTSGINVNERVAIGNEQVENKEHNDSDQSVVTNSRDVDEEPLEQKSYFMRYFKQEREGSLTRKPQSIYAADKHQSEVSQTGHPPAKTDGIPPRGPDSSEGECAGAVISASKEVERVSHDQRLDSKPSTSGRNNQTCENLNSNESWISLREIFPDFNEVDDDVLNLLPSPMQRQFSSRIQKRIEKASGSDKEEEGLENQQRANNSESSKTVSDDGHANSLTKHLKVVKQCNDKHFDVSSKNNHTLSKSNFRKSTLSLNENNSDMEDTPDIVQSLKPKNTIIVEAEVNHITTEDYHRNRNKNCDLSKKLVNKRLLENCNDLNEATLLTHSRNTQVLSNDINNDNSRNPSAKKRLFDALANNESSERNFAFDEIEVAVDSDVSRSSSILPVNISEASEDSLNMNTIETCKMDSENSSVKDILKNDENVLLKEICPHCNKEVPLLEYPEHLDFHVAKELDKQLNCSATVVSVRSNTSSAQKFSSKELIGKRKRGRAVKSQRASNTDKKTRSITAFFTPMK